MCTSSKTCEAENSEPLLPWGHQNSGCAISQEEGWTHTSGQILIWGHQKCGSAISQGEGCTRTSEQILFWHHQKCECVHSEGKPLSNMNIVLHFWVMLIWKSTQRSSCSSRQIATFQNRSSPSGCVFDLRFSASFPHWIIVTFVPWAMTMLSVKVTTTLPGNSSCAFKKTQCGTVGM